MKMVPLTEEQAIEVTGQEYCDSAVFNPVQDINGIWFISELERDLGSQSFPWLSNIGSVDFVPVPFQR